MDEISLEQFEILFKTYEIELLKYIDKNLEHDENLSNDLLEDTYIAAKKSLPKLRDENRFPAWLKKIAWHIWSNNYKGETRRCYDPVRVRKAIQNEEVDRIRYSKSKLDPSLLAIFLKHRDKGEFQLKEVSGEKISKSLREILDKAGFLADLKRIVIFPFYDETTCVNELNPETKLLLKEKKEKIRKILKKVPLKHRRCLELKIVKGMSVKKIAEKFGIKENTVHWRIAKAIEMLRGQMKDNMDFWLGSIFSLIMRNNYVYC
ncbi:sigma-70 family RNA polymerase sigma factor [bacterium]|nr:sigma-70 family RNA polymerase sigma factor [bacterium]MBU1024991.1 sigma-70 family RNA polymerase sigma factor [bacterium]